MLAVLCNKIVVFLLLEKEKNVKNVKRFCNKKCIDVFFEEGAGHREAFYSEDT